VRNIGTPRRVLTLLLYPIYLHSSLLSFSRRYLQNSTLYLGSHEDPANLPTMRARPLQ
jgi:hypothetical protein